MPALKACSSQPKQYFRGFQQTLWMVDKALLPCNRPVIILCPAVIFAIPPSLQNRPIMPAQLKQCQVMHGYFLILLMAAIALILISVVLSYFITLISHFLVRAGEPILKIPDSEVP